MLQHGSKNNLTVLSIARGFAKYAFTYLLPYLTPPGCGVLIVGDNNRNDKTSSKMESVDIKNDMIWQLLKIRHEKLLTVGKRRLIRKQQKSGYGVGTIDGWIDYLDIVSGFGDFSLSPLNTVKDATMELWN